MDENGCGSSILWKISNVFFKYGCFSLLMVLQLGDIMCCCVLLLLWCVFFLITNRGYTGSPQTHPTSLFIHTSPPDTESEPSV